MRCKLHPVRHRRTECRPKAPAQTCFAHRNRNSPGKKPICLRRAAYAASRLLRFMASCSHLLSLSTLQLPSTSFPPPPGPPRRSCLAELQVACWQPGHIEAFEAYLADIEAQTSCLEKPFNARKALNNIRCPRYCQWFRGQAVSNADHTPVTHLSCSVSV